ncbi:MAG: inositol 2-dehydrogenase [Planctomycetaceae bacterium]|nr:inositol 2-dehydrogenase [Planctomycetaceae bacterium]
MSQEMKIGLIGAGRIGRVHIAAMHRDVPGVSVGVVCDLVEEKATGLAAEYGVAKTAVSYREVCADPTVDAIAVCTNTESHIEIIECAARYGKHIFCEKPLALSLPDIDRALAVVKESGVLFMLAFNHRYDPGNTRLKQDIAAGVIGRPEMVFITGRDPSLQPLDYLKTSGGIFLDTVIHDFDCSRYLLDDEPEEIYARGECNVDPAIASFGDYDTVMLIARFKNGTLVHYNNSRRAVYGFDQRIEAFGSKGKIETSNILETNLTYAHVDGYHRPPNLNFFMDRYVQAYREEGRIFADCVKNGRTPPSGGFDGRQAVLMGLAAKKSAAENRPVRLEEVDIR